MVNLTNEEHQILCELAQRAEAAEARATNAEARVAGLLQSIRELSESISTLRAERDEARYELNTLHIESEARAAQLEAERDEANRTQVDEE